MGDVTVAMPIFLYAATVAMRLIYKLGIVQFETLNMYCFKCPLGKHWTLTVWLLYQFDIFLQKQ